MVNRKILTSLMILGIVGALAGGSTFALLNDTETSDTNTFQAGPVEVNVETPPGQPLAQMDDVKPGDVAEEEVEVVTEGNPAYVEMRLNQAEENTENSCTEPEAEAEGGDCGDEGELRENTHLDVWHDDNGNGEMDDDEEVILRNPHENAEQLEEGMMIDADPSTEEIEPVTDSKTVMYRWEVPRDLGNEAQTDSFSYNLEVRAEQARHNGPEEAAEWHQVTGEDAVNNTDTEDEPDDNASEQDAEEQEESDTAGFSDGETSDTNEFESDNSSDEGVQSNAEQEAEDDTTEETSQEGDSDNQFSAGLTGVAGLTLALLVAASALYRRRL